ncbi:MAG: alpha-galactosidase [Verrucomicrobiae bacterium]|nr:alpha-galactosidase [Verrucomicrobiae bacterium]
MIKIVFIGAGSAVFTKNLILDVLAYTELQDCVLALMDIDARRLDQIGQLARKVVEFKGLRHVKIETHADRRQALAGADYVITLFRQGGLEACELDVDIPLKYGLSQCMGDNMGPGGVFRALRTVPVLLDVCRDMRAVCPDAWLLNYVNPMAIVTRALHLARQPKVLGICHSVVNTAKELSEYCGVRHQEITYFTAGTNHLAWYLKLEHQGKDLYPLLREKMLDPQIHARDRVRFEILRHFGCFVTESSYHFSEYVPYFRKDPRLIEDFGIPAKMGYQWVVKNRKTQDREIDELISGRREITQGHSGEYAVDIIHSLETDCARCVNLNVSNQGMIRNFPPDVCVEVPCLVNRSGVHPVVVGDLPPQLAALNLTNINVHELAARAAIHHDRDLAFQAIALDPLTAAVLSLSQIRKLTDEMFASQQPYLHPGFY